MNHRTANRICDYLDMLQISYVAADDTRTGYYGVTVITRNQPELYIIIKYISDFKQVITQRVINNGPKNVGEICFLIDCRTNKEKQQDIQNGVKWNFNIDPDKEAIISELLAEIETTEPTQQVIKRGVET